MPPALDGKEQVRGAGEIDGELDVGRTARLHDECRVLVHLAIEHAARRVVSCVTAKHKVAAQRVAERLHVRAREHDLGAVARDGAEVAVDTGRRAQDRRPGTAGWDRSRRSGGKHITRELAAAQHDVDSVE